jgi:hypothetical protein
MRLPAILILEIFTRRKSENNSLINFILSIKFFIGTSGDVNMAYSADYRKVAIAFKQAGHTFKELELVVFAVCGEGRHKRYGIKRGLLGFHLPLDNLHRVCFNLPTCNRFQIRYVKPRIAGKKEGFFYFHPSTFNVRSCQPPQFVNVEKN